MLHCAIVFHDFSLFIFIWLIDLDNVERDVKHQTIIIIVPLRGLNTLVVFCPLILLTIRGRLITPFVLGSMSVGLNILIRHSFMDLWFWITALVPWPQLLYTLPQGSGGGVWWFHIFHLYPSVILPSVHLYYLIRVITLVTINGFSPNLVRVLILWRSGPGCSKRR